MRAGGDELMWRGGEVWARGGELVWSGGDVQAGGTSWCCGVVVKCGPDEKLV